MQEWAERLRRQRRGYEHYVVVMQSHDVAEVMQTLSKIGLALDALSLVVHEDNTSDDVLFTITPSDVRHAHDVLARACDESWFGHTP